MPTTDRTASTGIDARLRELARHAHFGSPEFRTGYRESIVPGHYSGRLHLLMTIAVPSAGIALCLWSLANVTGKELLAVPITFLYANLVEYVGHRGPMHHRIRALAVIYRHVTIHHGFYTAERTGYEQPRDFHALLLPPPTLLLFGLLAGPAALLLLALFSANVCFLFLATAFAYYLNHELLHFAYHTPEDSRLASLPILRVLRRHHVTHHRPDLMTRYNFNITYPIFDWLLGTTYSGGPGRRHHPARSGPLVP
jgi:hypothetical protein